MTPLRHSDRHLAQLDHVEDSSSERRGNRPDGEIEVWLPDTLAAYRRQ